MNTRQFGKKIGKHTQDWGLNPKNATDRKMMARIIDDIIINYDEIRSGEWLSQPGFTDFYIKGRDVVVVNNGNFVTILKDGIDNARVRNSERGNKNADI